MRAALVSALAVVTLAGTAWAQEDSEDKAPPAAVSVAAAQLQDLAETVSYNGRLDADASIDIHARVSGPVIGIGFNAGDMVKKGDILFKIDPELYAAAKKQAEGSVESGKASMRLAEIERDRQAELVDRKAVAQAVLDRALADLGSSTGALMQAEASLDTATLNLSYTNVVAPFDGRVGPRNYDLGALISPEMPLTTLTKLDPIHAVFQVPTADLRRAMDRIGAGELETSDIVQMTLSDGKLYPTGGKLDFVDNIVNVGTDSIEVRAEFSNPDGKLKHDELVLLTLAGTSADKVLTIPVAALQRDLVGDFVMVVTDESKAQKTYVTTERTVGTSVVISEGLSEGDKVIVEGVNKARDGAKVDAALVEEGDNQ